MQSSRARVRRVDTVAERSMAGGGDAADYVDAFAVDGDTAGARPAERWARRALETAPPRPLRWVMLFGWRIVLGLRLGPVSAPDRVMGWRIAAAAPDAVVLEARSWLITANLTFRQDGDGVLWNTLVRYENPAARPVWAVVGLLHRRIVPYVLARAATLP